MKFCSRRLRDYYKKNKIIIQLSIFNCLLGVYKKNEMLIIEYSVEQE